MRRFRRGGDGGEEVIEFAQREVGGFGLGPAVAVGGGERRHVHTGHQRAESGGEAGARGRHGRRRDGATVKSALEDNDIRPSGGLAGQAQRGLYRLAAGVGEEQRVQTFGQHRAEALDEFEQRPVHDGGVLAVDQAGDLGLGRRDHMRMAVTGAGYADARGEVEIAATVGAVEVAARTVVDGYRGGLLENGG